MITSLELIDNKSPFCDLYEDCYDMSDLPLTHKQDWFTAEMTIKNGKIKAMPCSVFKGENLVYCFYGRPSYSVSNNTGTRGDDVYYPVCYIININSIQINKVFPFDSGAFAKDLFKGFFHEKMNINDFSIKPTIPQIKGFIKKFFGNNNNYYRNKPCDLRSYVDNCIVQAYVNLINNKGEEAFDERSSTIEILSKEDIDLCKCLEAIILPYDLAYKIKIKETFQKNDIEVITYDTFGGNPGGYNGVIRQLLYNYLIKKKSL